MKSVVLLAAVAAAIVAAGSPAASTRPAAHDPSGFSGDLPTGTHLVVRPLYRERVRSTPYRLRSVACAPGAARGASCFVAR